MQMSQKAQGVRQSRLDKHTFGAKKRYCSEDEVHRWRVWGCGWWVLSWFVWEGELENSELWRSWPCLSMHGSLSSHQILLVVVWWMYGVSLPREWKPTVLTSQLLQKTHLCCLIHGLFCESQYVFLHSPHSQMLLRFCPQIFYKILCVASKSRDFFSGLSRYITHNWILLIDDYEVVGVHYSIKLLVVLF